MANSPPLPQQLPCVSTDEEHGLRLQLLIERAAEILRNKFHRYFSSDPKTLYQQLSGHQILLNQYLTRRILYQDQYALLFPANGLTDSGSFDICLLTFLLRQLCGLPSPGTGWSVLPSPTDQTESAHLVRIRFGRNKVQHGGLKWDFTNFTEVWDEITDSLIALGCTNTEIDNLRICPLDSTTVQKLQQCRVQLKASIERVSHLEDCLDGLSYKIFPPISSFIGREKDIQRIQENLLKIEDNKIALVITGFGGVGKTELVRHYCQEYGAKLYKSNTIWINAESVASITVAFNNVAELIKLDVKDAKGNFVDPKVVITKVFRFFASTNVLFVFDNVVNITDLNDFLSLYVQVGVKKPYVIITSQNIQWGERFVTQKVKVFTPLTAEAFVNCALKNNHSLNKDNNKNICNLVEYHPLALQQVVAYIQKTGLTVDNYIKEFKYQKQLLLSEKCNDILYSQTVMTTWNMAINKIKEENNHLALTIIIIMSYLDGKNINKKLFLNLCDNNVIYLNKAIDILQQYSIINVSESNDNTKEILMVHSLVQFVISINEQLTDKEQVKLVLDFFNNILEIPLGYTKECLAFENLWGHHVIYMIKSQRNKDIMLMFINNLKFLNTILLLKGKLYQLHDIIRILQNFVLETRNSDKYDYIILYHLAQCLMRQGKVKEALQKYYYVEKKRLALFGPNDNNLLLTQTEIATCLTEQDKLDEALEKYYYVEKKQLSLFGPTDNNLLLTQTEIATCLMEQDKLDESLEKYFDVEKKQLILFGPNHYNLLATQVHIATCLMRQGKLGEALEKYCDVEKKQLTLFGPNHNNLIVTQVHIATCLMEQGKLDEALEKYCDIEKKRLTLFGPNHHTLLVTQTNIATCLMEQDKLDEALEKYFNIEKKQLALFGPNHYNLLLTQTNIATCLMKQDKLDEALEKYYDVEKKELTLFGPNHNNLLITQDDIATCLMKQNKLDEALEKYCDVEKKGLTSIGPNNNILIETQVHIATCLMYQDKLVEALEKYFDVEKKQLTLFGPNHNSLLVTQAHIATCLMKQDKLDEALEKYFDVEKKQLTLFGPNHNSLLVTQAHIPTCLMKQDKLDEALEKYFDVEKKQLTLFGPNHNSLLVTQAHIATCLMKQDKLDEALEKYFDVEKKQITLFGPNHNNLIVTQTNIAICLMKQDKLDEALEKYFDVEKKQLTLFGPNHNNLIVTQTNIAICLSKQYKFSEALEIFRNIEKKRSQTHESNHPYVIQIREIIACCVSMEDRCII